MDNLIDQQKQAKNNGNGWTWVMEIQREQNTTGHAAPEHWPCRSAFQEGESLPNFMPCEKHIGRLFIDDPKGLLKMITVIFFAFMMS